MKKIFTVLLALILILSLSTSAFAAPVGDLKGNALGLEKSNNASWSRFELTFAGFNGSGVATVTSFSADFTYVVTNNGALSNGAYANVHAINLTGKVVKEIKILVEGLIEGPIGPILTNDLELTNFLTDNNNALAYLNGTFSNVKIPEGKSFTLVGLVATVGQVTATKANIVLDHLTISTDAYGVYTEGDSNITVKNSIFNITPNSNNNNTAFMTWTWKGNNKNLIIENNVFNTNGMRGIQIRSCDSSLINGNTFNMGGTTLYAIQFDNTPLNAVVSANTFNGTSLGVYVHTDTTGAKIELKNDNLFNNVAFPFASRPKAANEISNLILGEFGYWIPASVLNDPINGLPAVPEGALVYLPSLEYNATAIGANGYKGSSFIINKPMTIKGNGAVIYAESSAAMGIVGNISGQNTVTINADHVTLEGLTFMPIQGVDSNTNQYNKALEVLNTATSVTIKNCRFIPNTKLPGNNAVGYAGQVSINTSSTSSKETIKILNSYFEGAVLDLRTAATIKENTFNSASPVHFAALRFRQQWDGASNTIVYTDVDVRDNSFVNIQADTYGLVLNEFVTSLFPSLSSQFSSVPVHEITYVTATGNITVYFYN